jgi:hypothetical protein
MDSYIEVRNEKLDNIRYQCLGQKVKWRCQLLSFRQVKASDFPRRAQPEGGHYRILTGIGPNMELRARGVKSALAITKWIELAPPISCNESSTLAIQQLYDLLHSDSNLQGIVSLGGWPMYEPEAFRLLSEKY